MQISTGNNSSGGGAVMFGEEFGDCWHEIPGVSGLELSGDLRFRGPRVLRKLRHDCNGRPYVQARKVVNHESDGRVRAEGRRGVVDGGLALVHDAAHREEAVDLALEATDLGPDASGAEPRGVGLALVAQRVVLGGDHA